MPNAVTGLSGPRKVLVSIVVLECCVEGFEHVAKVLAAGANRIELCDNLAVGGTTPSLGVMTQAARLTHEAGGRVMAMIRPRGGDYAYDAAEVEAMAIDIRAAAQAGVDGIVLGCVRDGRLDEPVLERLLPVGQELGLEVTFHMAFDELDESEQLAAIDWLSGHGVARILTHGSADLSVPIAENLDRIARYARHAAGRLVIMPGGGVTRDNVHSVCEAIGMDEAHGTKIVG